jgi:hypothetical protein
MTTIDSVAVLIDAKFPAWKDEDLNILAAFLFIKIHMQDFMDTLFEAPKHVDALWIQFISETQCYSKFCEEACGRTLHRVVKLSNAKRLAATEYLIAHYSRYLEEKDEIFVGATAPSTPNKKRARPEEWITLQCGNKHTKVKLSETDTVEILYQIVSQWINNDDFLIDLKGKELNDGSLLLMKDLGVEDGSLIIVRKITQ